jgi:hypothetical protein
MFSSQRGVCKASLIDSFIGTASFQWIEVVDADDERVLAFQAHPST